MVGHRKKPILRVRFGLITAGKRNQVQIPCKFASKAMTTILDIASLPGGIQEGRYETG